jgi:preprotein translocase subunit SecE
MSRDKEVATESGGLGDWFSLEPYKRSQGRITRQMTFFALVTLIAIGAYELMIYLRADGHLTLAYSLLVGIIAVGAWISYRAVNLPHFADFLIAVEAEMYKVTWPTWDDVVRATIVVIVVMFSMAMVLFLFDMFFQLLFSWLGVVAI